MNEYFKLKVSIPVKSYIAFPAQGENSQFISDLKKIRQCEVHPAENKDVLVLVTDTKGKEEEAHLKVAVPIESGSLRYKNHPDLPKEDQ